MNKEEFRAKQEENDEWAPGWDAIESVFEKLYPNQVPAHFATNYGKTEFIQLVGITEQELEMIKADPSKAKKLIELMKKDDPFLVTDLTRKKSYCNV